MPIADEIRANAHAAFLNRWEERTGTVVPNTEDVKLGNDAVHFDRATILYADLDQSTMMVEKKIWWFSAEVYKTYLYAASRLIRSEGGSIMSYDGDRVMGVFIGGQQCNTAVRCALKINYAVKKIVQDELKSRYKDTDFNIKHVVGIDTGEVRVARTGIRGSNDLVWVGNPANIAAKLTGRSSNCATWITDRVYDYLDADRKIVNGQNMWKWWSWGEHQTEKVYGSTYWWSI